MNKTYRKEYFLSLVMIIFSLIGLYLTNRIKTLHDEFVVSAIDWPKSILIFIIVLSLVHIIVTYRNSKKELVIEESKESKENKEEEEITYNRTFGLDNRLVSFIGIFLYLVGLQLMGFVPSTLVFLIVIPLIIGFKNKKIVIIYALFTLALIILIFPKLLSVSLPKGIGIFRNFNSLFY